MTLKPNRLIDRELSWLAFNGRVLQEAASDRVPLVERLRFLAIFSSNLDEFFRVRVASLRSLLRLKKKSVEKLAFDPALLLAQIRHEVDGQQRLFGQIFDSIVAELEKHGIEIICDRDLAEDEVAFAREYFAGISGLVDSPLVLEDDDAVPFLKNRSLYLITELWAKGEANSLRVGESKLGVVEIPSDRTNRFVSIPTAGGRKRILFLDDVLRANAAVLYPSFELGETYSVKTTRDAELYLEDEYSGNLVEMIRTSLGKRHLGPPTRFLYDSRMPYPLVNRLKLALNLTDEDLVSGGRYHNFNDFFTFPHFKKKTLLYSQHVPVAHPEFPTDRLVLDVVREGDRMLHLPYQSFDPVVRMLREAAVDDRVESISVTLYRVSADSGIVKALIQAAKAGKKVTAFVEVKARFDEARNLHWAAEMEQAGVSVLYSMPGIKVHCKLALIVRRESGKKRKYAYLATGNFNEKTALVYADHSLFTSNAEIARDVGLVFRRLSGVGGRPRFGQLLVAPDQLRKKLAKLVDREIANAKAGVPASMVLKMNSLEDERMIARLYRANAAGVQIRLIVRGICRLVPGIPGLSENIYATSIVDRFLEHARVFVFENGGDHKLYLGSADWMSRNLSRRVEVVFPVRDERIKKQVIQVLDFQIRDSSSARIIDRDRQNRFVASAEPSVRAQSDIQRFLSEASDWLVTESPS